jgi:hypothetical protein
MPVPRQIESVVRFLLPPACREHVLGDLHERYESPGQYVAEALSVLGPVIVSRIRRTTDLQVLLMETFSIYLSFSAAAWYLEQQAFLYDHAGFARLAVPTTLAVVGLLISNAYSDLEKQSPVKSMTQTAGSLALAFLGQAVLFDVHSLDVPFSVMLWGGCTSFFLVSTLRMIFPPIARRPTFVRPGESRPLPHGGLVPGKMPGNNRRERLGRIQRQPRTKHLIVYAALIALAILVGLSIWRNSQY